MWSVLVFSVLFGLSETSSIDKDVSRLPVANSPAIVLEDGRFCKMVITKDGIEVDDFVTAFGGSENQVFCKVDCPGVNPALRWYRIEGRNKTMISQYTKRKSAVRSQHQRASVLTFTNFLLLDVGYYKCKAWMGPEYGIVERQIEIRYGCRAPAFQCDNSRCLPESVVCDGKRDCDDGYDEYSCGECGADQFSCDRKCIPMAHRCDGFIDCHIDKADESNCDVFSTTEKTQTTTTPFEFGAYGDGDYDYSSFDEEDESDEASVSTTRTATASSTAATTPSSTAATKTPSTAATTPSSTAAATPSSTAATTPSSTEAATPSSTAATTPSSTMAAETRTDDESTTITTPDVTSTTPITVSTERSPIFSALGASTTQTAVQVCPLPEEFRCSTGQCIPEEWVCDGIEDCSDGLDERDCNNGCLAFQFMCDKIEGYCINQTAVCDGQMDCPYGQDEQGCCSADEFTCNDGSCIEATLACDFFPDCDDDSDEESCSPSLSCPESLRACDDQKACYREEQKCDGFSHCEDQSDERNCPAVKTAMGQPDVTTTAKTSDDTVNN